MDEAAVSRKLTSIDLSQECVETLSLWVLHHKQHSDLIAHVWIKCLRKATVQNRLALLYLCNDVLQRCRKDKPQFLGSFREVLLDAGPLLTDPKTRKNVQRVFNIWKERRVYEESFIRRLQEGSADPGGGAGGNGGGANRHRKSVAARSPSPPPPRTPPSPATRGQASPIDDDEVIDFEPTRLVEQVKKVRKLQLEVGAKMGTLSAAKLDISKSDVLAECKDRRHCEQFEKDFEEGIRCLRGYVSALETKLSERRELAQLLTDGSRYYAHQLSDVQLVTEAYRSFALRVKAVHDGLDRFRIPTPPPLPDECPSPTDSEMDMIMSPLPSSPPRAAPAPVPAPAMPVQPPLPPLPPPQSLLAATVAERQQQHHHHQLPTAAAATTTTTAAAAVAAEAKGVTIASSHELSANKSQDRRSSSSSALRRRERSRSPPTPSLSALATTKDEVFGFNSRMNSSASFMNSRDQQFLSKLKESLSRDSRDSRLSQESRESRESRDSRDSEDMVGTPVRDEERASTPGTPVTSEPSRLPPSLASNSSMPTIPGLGGSPLAGGIIAAAAMEPAVGAAGTTAVSPMIVRTPPPPLPPPPMPTGLLAPPPVPPTFLGTTPITTTTATSTGSPDVSPTAAASLPLRASTQRRLSRTSPALITCITSPTPQYRQQQHRPTTSPTSPHLLQQQHQHHHHQRQHDPLYPHHQRQQPQEQYQHHHESHKSEYHHDKHSQYHRDYTAQRSPDQQQHHHQQQQQPLQQPEQQQQQISTTVPPCPVVLVECRIPSSGMMDIDNDDVGFDDIVENIDFSKGSTTGTSLVTIPVTTTPPPATDGGNRSHSAKNDDGDGDVVDHHRHDGGDNGGDDDDDDTPKPIRTVVSTVRVPSNIVQPVETPPVLSPVRQRAPLLTLERDDDPLIFSTAPKVGSTVVVDGPPSSSSRPPLLSLVRGVETDSLRVAGDHQHQHHYSARKASIESPARLISRPPLLPSSRVDGPRQRPQLYHRPPLLPDGPLALLPLHSLAPPAAHAATAAVDVAAVAAVSGGPVVAAGTASAGAILNAATVEDGNGRLRPTTLGAPIEPLVGAHIQNTNGSYHHHHHFSPPTRGGRSERAPAPLMAAASKTMTVGRLSTGVSLSSSLSSPSSPLLVTPPAYAARAPGVPLLSSAPGLRNLAPAAAAIRGRGLARREYY